MDRLGDFHDLIEGNVLGVEVDDRVVRPVERFDPRAPGQELNAAEVDRPEQGWPVLGQVPSPLALAVVHPRCPHPRWLSPRNALPEILALLAIDVAVERLRQVLEVGQDDRGDFAIVVEQDETA
jgi:hypothetical protein